MEATRTRSTAESIARVVLSAALILLVPFLAMQFSDEVDWDRADFVIAGALLIGAGLAYELVIRKMRSTSHRVVFGVVLAAGVLVVWGELAVGIFGTPFSGN